MKKGPFFSIILPVFNRVHYIGGAIDSVLGQTFRDFELLIIDDGSTDNTFEVVNQYTDSRIRCFRKENEERNLARNFGIEQATGEFITFLDSDDYYLENHLEVAYRIIVEKKTNVIHLGYRIETSNRSESQTISLHPPIPIADWLIRENTLSSNGIVVQREVLKSIKFINSTDFVVGEDQLLWMQLAVRCPIELVNITTSVMVEHANRSLRSINPDKFARGLNDLVTHVSNDSQLQNYYKQRLDQFVGDKYRFASLLFALNGKRRNALVYLSKALRYDSQQVFQRTFWAVLKNLFLPN